MRHLCKLTQETQDGRFKILPVPLMRAQTAPPQNGIIQDRLFLYTDIGIDPEALELTM